jgi:hypothetical protein
MQIIIVIWNVLLLLLRRISAISKNNESNKTVIKVTFWLKSNSLISLTLSLY